MCSRWYTPDFHLVSTDIQAFVTSRHQSLYLDVQEITMTCL